LRDYGAKFADAQQSQQQQPTPLRRASETLSSSTGDRGTLSVTFFGGLCAFLALAGLMASAGCGVRRVVALARRRRGSGPYSELITKEGSPDAVASKGSDDEHALASDSTTANTE
jgi:hypothetical protein